MRLFTRLYFAVICPLVFILSYYFVVPTFTENDSKYYILFYESLSDMYNGWNNVFSASMHFIGTLEPGYIFLAKIFSTLGFSREFFSSFINLLFFIAIGFFSYKKNANLLIVLAFVLSSYYFLILLTGLDRLKLAIVFLLFALSYINKLKYFLIFFISSIFVHAQILSLAIPFLIIYFKNDISRLFCMGSLRLNFLFYCYFFH